jgi:hypothetical protein
LLTEDQIAVLQEVKEVFLSEKVAEGVLSQEEADAIMDEILSREEHEALKDLGFGRWLRDSDYFDTVSEFMPRANGQMKGEGSRDGLGRGSRGQGRGQARGLENGLGTCVNP